MMSRTAYLSAFRNLRAPADPVSTPSVSSPVGAVDSTTVQARNQAASNPIDEQIRLFLTSALGRRFGGAQGQSQALRRPTAWDQLPGQMRAQAQSGYGAGGFEGVRSAMGSAIDQASRGSADWYDIPSHARTQILAGARE